VQAARDIKVLFTGHLERAIRTNPFFFKTEKFYLRAQIARIMHSTSLCPKGLFRLQEDSLREIEDNTPEEGELELPSTWAMSQPQMWVHSQPAILLNNRTSHKEPEVPEGEDIEPEELLRRIEAADPYEARLKPVTLDKQVSVSKHSKTSSWVVKMMGDSSEFKDSAGRVESNGVVVARSLQWPGAFNFYSKGRYFFFYVGDGLKYEDKQFFPVSPP